MLADKITNYKIYTSLDKKICSALEFLSAGSLNKAEPGKYEIEGNNIYAIVSRYQTKSLTEGRFEAHRKYIDVQYIIEGSEIIGYSPFNKQKLLKEYNEQKDCIFYEVPGKYVSHLHMQKGMFAVFYPEDLHMPGISDIPQEVKKIVVKINLQALINE